jgi:hypothetical protein
MDTAHDIVTGKIVDAEDLWTIENVDKSRYVCRGCGIPVIPASFGPHNKVRPYFTPGHTPHRSGCDVDGVAMLIARARCTRVSDPRSGIPASIPSQLVLHETREVVDRNLSERADRSRGISARGPSAQRPATNTERRYAASHLRPLCRTFVKFPYDRDAALQIPGLRGSTYEELFWRLKQNEIIRYPVAHTFYGPMSWSRAVQDDAFLELTLNAGEWRENRLVRPYRVRLGWTHWSPAQRRAVLHEIEVARHETIEARQRHGKERGWVFFIGTQLPDLDDVFEVHDHRLVCCLVVEMLYPTRAGHRP